MNTKLIEFIKASPTAFHAVDTIKAELKSRGLTELTESSQWNIEKGKGYFVTRNLSSIIAFKVPDNDIKSFMIAASHSDSPAIKIKENPELKDKFYIRLSTEKYGGMINSTWLDRPLSVAGRVLVKENGGVKTKLVDFKEAVVLIPNVAIHLNRKVNEGAPLNAAVDMIPLFSLQGEDKETFIYRVAKLCGVDDSAIVATDLMLYNSECGVEWSDFISAPRLDDLQCVFASLKAFEEAENVNSMPVLAVFDNEEVGSRTRQGADSTFLTDVLKKVSACMSMSESEFSGKIANSMMLSCDNAHGVHPNHTEMTDANHQSVLNGGIVIKYNANQQYSTDGVAAALFKLVCEKAEVPFQSYTNRADIPGGSTLGNIANTQLSMISADIGLAQLAMHSSFETAGGKDTEYMVKALKEFFSSAFTMNSDGHYEFV